MSKKRLILTQPLLDICLKRLCQEIIENHDNLKDSVILGLQPRGVFLSDRLVNMLELQLGHKIAYGKLDATFYRDDFRRRESPLTPNTTHIPFVIENKKVILIDDVLSSGRTVRAALDAMQAFGRPLKVELLVLIDRSYNRDLPIQPDYVGQKVNTLDSQKVLVEWQDLGAQADNIWLMN